MPSQHPAAVEDIALHNRRVIELRNSARLERRKGQLTAIGAAALTYVVIFGIYRWASGS